MTATVLRTNPYIQWLYVPHTIRPVAICAAHHPFHDCMNLSSLKRHNYPDGVSQNEIPAVLEVMIREFLWNTRPSLRLPTQADVCAAHLWSTGIMLCLVAIHLAVYTDITILLAGISLLVWFGLSVAVLCITLWNIIQKRRAIYAALCRIGRPKMKTLVFWRYEFSIRKA